MARNIRQIADGLGAKVSGQMPDTGGGVFVAIRAAQNAEWLSAKASSGLFPCEMQPKNWM